MNHTDSNQTMAMHAFRARPQDEILGSIWNMPRTACLIFALFLFVAGCMPLSGVGFIKIWAQAISAMDRNEMPEQQRQQVMGVRPVDEDSDKVLLAQAIAADLLPFPQRTAGKGCHRRCG